MHDGHYRQGTGGPDPTAGAPGERIIGIVPMVRKKTGLLSTKTYDLLVTDRRVIFSVISKEVTNQAVREATEESKARGKGLPGKDSG